MLKNWVQRAEFNERWTHSQQPTHCSPLNHHQPGHRPPAFPVASLPPPALLYSTNSESLGIVCLQSLRILSLTQIVSLSARIELSQSDSRIGIVSRKEKGEMANLLYVRAELSADLNKNTEWFAYPGVWTTYILIVFFFWMTVLSLIGCSFGMAWTIVNVGHSFATYHFFHWKKGTPFADDQGIYNGLTWWEQIDNGKQLTRNRKFLTIVPVVLYLISSHTTDYQNPMLFFNTLTVFVLVVAKFPHMHKVRLFGINGDH